VIAVIPVKGESFILALIAV